MMKDCFLNGQKTAECRDRNGLTEEEFLTAYKPRDHDNPAVTADAVVVVVRNGQLSKILMIRRGNHPYLNCRALPGGFVSSDETTEEAAFRELKEETGLSTSYENGCGTAEFLGVWSRPGRDPRMRVISCAYMIPAAEEIKVTADDDAAEASWFDIDVKTDSASGRKCITLTRSDAGRRETPEILKISFSVTEKKTISGIMYGTEDVRSEGIAFDHAEMIAAAFLKTGSIRKDENQSGRRIAVAGNATITGNVMLSPGVSIWYGAVLRGDLQRIVIGENSNVQDNAVIHVTQDRETIIGKNVTIGHAAVIHGCTIEDDSLIGMNATVLNRAVIGKGSIVGAGAVVTEDRIIPPGSLVLGIPGKVVRQLTPEEIAGNRKNAEAYLELSKNLPDDG